MARFGTGINASLGAINYTPYMQGAMAGSQSIAQGIASLGQIAGGAIRDYKQKKEEEKKIGETINFLETNFKKDPGTYAMFDDGSGNFDRDAANAAVRSVGPNGVMTFINFSQAAQANRDIKAEKDAEKARRKAVDSLLGISDPVAQQSALAAATDDVRSAFQQENLKRQLMQAQIEGERSQTTLRDTQALTLAQDAQTPKRPTAPAGYEYTPSGTLRAIEGGPAAFAQEQATAERADKEEKKQQEEVARQKAIEDQKIKIAQTLQNIKSAKSLSLNKGAGGPLETIPGYARGIEAVAPKFLSDVMVGGTRDLVNLTESIRSGIAIDQILALKAASPSGSTGLGNMSNADRETLTTSLANLDPSLDEATYRKRLEDIERVLLKLYPSASNMNTGTLSEIKNFDPNGADADFKVYLPSYRTK